MSLGKLYLVPNKLGESKSNFPEHQQTLISSTKYFIFENEKKEEPSLKI